MVKYKIIAEVRSVPETIFTTPKTLTIKVTDKKKFTLFLVGTGETRGCNRPDCYVEPITKNHPC